MSDEKNWYDTDTYTQQNMNMPNTSGTNTGFATASMVSGIAALGLSFTGVLSIPAGALGLLFASLSSRKGKALLSKARTGIVMSVIGLVVGIILTISSLITVMQAGGIMNYLSQNMKQIYGEDFDFEKYMGIDDYSSFQDYLNGAETFDN